MEPYSYEVNSLKHKTSNIEVRFYLGSTDTDTGIRYDTTLYGDTTNLEKTRIRYGYNTLKI